MQYPVMIPFFGRELHPHPIFEILAGLVGFQVYLWGRRKRGDHLRAAQRQSVIVAAILGAVVGAKLAAWAVDPSVLGDLLAEPLRLIPGKSIVGALLGGLFAVDLYKRIAGIPGHTGDAFAMPLVVGIAIGRIGCHLTGLEDATSGIPTDMPWGLDYGDGIPRHPTALLEIGFLVSLGIWITRRARWPHAQGILFRDFLVAYFAWRLLIDALKPYPSFLGLGGLQWACLLGLSYLFLGRRYARPQPEGNSP